VSIGLCPTARASSTILTFDFIGLRRRSGKYVPLFGHAATTSVYTRDVARVMDILRILHAWPVSTEASQILNECRGLQTEEVTPRAPKTA